MFITVRTRYTCYRQKFPSLVPIAETEKSGLKEKSLINALFTKRIFCFYGSRAEDLYYEKFYTQLPNLISQRQIKAEQTNILNP